MQSYENTAGPSPALQHNSVLDSAIGSSAPPPQSSASPAALAAWRKFEQCLAHNGLSFEDVKDADAGARIEMLVSIGGASLLFGGGGTNNDTNALPSKGAVIDAAASVAQGTNGPPSLTGVEMALISSRWNAMVPTAATGASIPLQRGGAAGQLHAANNNGAFAANVQASLPFLDPSHGRSLLHRGTTDLLEELKAHLSVGQSAPAFAIASELLHRDPVPMLRVLHEFAPHLSLSQLQEILGVRAAAAPSSQQGHLSSSFGDGRSGAGRNALGLPLTGSLANSGPDSPQLRRAGAAVPTLNDIPLRVGAVLTEGALSAQFGVGFRASFARSGRMIPLPHCVQEGDSIIVLRSSEVVR